MKTYYVKFQVVPSEDNERYNLVEGALASCWVLANDAQSAYAQAAFYVSKYDWIIEKVDTSPVEAIKEHFPYSFEAMKGE